MHFHFLFCLNLRSTPPPWATSSQVPYPAAPKVGTHPAGTKVIGIRFLHINICMQGIQQKRLLSRRTRRSRRSIRSRSWKNSSLASLTWCVGFSMMFSFLDWGQLSRSQLGVLMTRWKNSSLASLTWCVGFSMMFSVLDWGQLQRQLWKDPMRRPQTSSLACLTWWMGFSMKLSFLDWGLGVLKPSLKSSLASLTWWVKCWFFCCAFLLPRPVDSPTEADSWVPPSPTVLPPSPTSPAEPEEPTILSPADKTMCFGLSLESCCFFCTSNVWSWSLSILIDFWGPWKSQSMMYHWTLQGRFVFGRHCVHLRFFDWQESAGWCWRWAKGERGAGGAKSQRCVTGLIVVLYSKVIGSRVIGKVILDLLYCKVIVSRAIGRSILDLLYCKVIVSTVIGRSILDLLYSKVIVSKVIGRSILDLL